MRFGAFNKAQEKDALAKDKTEEARTKDLQLNDLQRGAFS